MFAPPSAPRNPIEDLDPVYLTMAAAMAGEEAMRRRMQEQMDEAKEIGDSFRPKDPELPVDYRPPERHTYPTPVRLAMADAPANRGKPMFEVGGGQGGGVSRGTGSHVIMRRQDLDSFFQKNFNRNATEEEFVNSLKTRANQIKSDQSEFRKTQGDLPYAPAEELRQIRKYLRE